MREAQTKRRSAQLGFCASAKIAMASSEKKEEEELIELEPKIEGEEHLEEGRESAEQNPLLEEKGGKVPEPKGK